MKLIEEVLIQLAKIKQSLALNLGHLERRSTVLVTYDSSSTSEQLIL